MGQSRIRWQEGSQSSRSRKNKPRIAQNALIILNSEMRTAADQRETDCQEAARKGEQSESNYTEHTDKEGLMIEVRPVG